ncbi:helix-turn-helix domain-containing protein [Corynebacterium parakroppenstedtii]|uniref:helix-turn-helix domain-containing protein n=1 Tax=Corynebacterium parakroppenstedtii TaxID=2828363 RepID=UPI001C8DD271|nr:hypothetical protein [Corynebacterium parakroppenstedtii]MBY0797278.1 hypothetical protein [Corynebacterium parakroppenstedtii]
MSGITDFTGANIKALRGYMGMSRAELLRQLEDDYGISLHQSSLKRIEDGEQPVKAYEAVALSEIFDIELHKLVTEPLEDETANLNALTRKYRSAVSSLIVANWQAMEGRMALEKALKNLQHVSSARREAEGLLKSDEPLNTAMANLNKAFNEVSISGKKDMFYESR